MDSKAITGEEPKKTSPAKVELSKYTDKVKVVKVTRQADSPVQLALFEPPIRGSTKTSNSKDLNHSRSRHSNSTKSISPKDIKLSDLKKSSIKPEENKKTKCVPNSSTTSHSSSRDRCGSSKKDYKRSSSSSKKSSSSKSKESSSSRSKESSSSSSKDSSSRKSLSSKASPGSSSKGSPSSSSEASSGHSSKDQNRSKSKHSGSSRHKSDKSSNSSRSHRSKEHKSSETKYPIAKRHSSTIKEKSIKLNGDLQIKASATKLPESPSKFKLSSVGLALFDSPVKSHTTKSFDLDHASKSPILAHTANEVKLSQSSTEDKKRLEMSVLVESQLPIFDSQTWDTALKIQPLSDDNHTVGHKRCSEDMYEKEAKHIKIESSETSPENRQPLKAKFSVCKRNGYKLVSSTSGYIGRPFITQTKEQAIYEFHLQRTIARVRNQEKMQVSLF